MSDRADLIAQNRENSIAGAWERVLDTSDGRLVIWSILDGCWLFSQTHLGNEMDGLRAGMREVGLKLLRERIFPHNVRTFSDMQMEHADLMERIERAVELETEPEDDEDA